MKQVSCQLIIPESLRAATHFVQFTQRNLHKLSGDRAGSRASPEVGASCVDISGEKKVVHELLPGLDGVSREVSHTGQPENVFVDGEVA